MNLAPPLHAESQRTLVQKIYAAFSRRDIGGVLDRCTADIELVQSTELPWGGEYRGHEGARDFFGRLTEHINSTVTVDRLIGAGNHVVAVGWTSGTVNATGAHYHVPFAHVWTISDGLVARAEFYIDHQTMRPALHAEDAK